MIIERKRYLDRLAKLEGNGLVKVVTGIRRCGKSFLLFTLFREALRRKGVDDAHVVAVQLDDDEAAPLRTPRTLSGWIKARLPGRRPSGLRARHRRRHPLPPRPRHPPRILVSAAEQQP